MRKSILIVFLFISGFLFAQKTERDVVYLKNGSVVKGKITEMNPSESLKIQTSDGSLFVYGMTDILKMEKEEVVGKEVNQETTSIVSQSSLEKVFTSYISKNRPAIKFIGVSKKNGVKREIYGQKVYEIEYELILETRQDIYINGSQFGSAFSNKFITDFSYSLRDASGYEAAFSASKKKLVKGQRILVEGSIVYEETDNGWRSTKFVNKNFKTVSPNYLSPVMAKQKAEENIKLEKELKIKLDWKKDDIDPIEFNPKYFLIENVPLFEYGNSKFIIKPSSSYSGRNDVLSDIQKSFYEGLNTTYRFINSDENSYSLSQNTATVTFIISKVDFVLINNGYKCSIVLNSKTKGVYTEPKTLPFDINKTITARSNILKRNLSKSQALSSALKSLKKKVRDYIFEYEPIRLDFIRVEVNKKGKVDKVIFKKPTHFINTNKMKFVVLAPTDLVVRNDKFSLINKVGECTFKGEIIGNEIICEIKGSKNKKAFGKLLNINSLFIAISSY